MLICPTAFFKDETRMNSHARKVQKNGHKYHIAIPSGEESKNSINLFSHSQLQYKLCNLTNDCYCIYVKLPIHSHAEVTVVIANLGVRIFAILLLIRMNPDLGMD